MLPSKNMILHEVTSGLALSIVGFIMITLLSYGLSNIGISIEFGGDKSSVLLGIFIGLPVGSLVGITLVNKLYSEIYRFYVIGWIIGFILSSSLGGIAVLLLLDKMGIIGILFGPLIVVCLSLLGLRSVVFLAGNRVGNQSRAKHGAPGRTKSNV